MMLGGGNAIITARRGRRGAQGQSPSPVATEQVEEQPEVSTTSSASRRSRSPPAITTAREQTSDPLSPTLSSLHSMVEDSASGIPELNSYQGYTATLSGPAPVPATPESRSQRQNRLAMETDRQQGATVEEVPIANTQSGGRKRGGLLGALRDRKASSPPESEPIANAGYEPGYSMGDLSGMTPMPPDEDSDASFAELAASASASIAAGASIGRSPAAMETPTKSGGNFAESALQRRLAEQAKEQGTILGVEKLRRTIGGKSPDTEETSSARKDMGVMDRQQGRRSAVSSPSSSESEAPSP